LRGESTDGLRAMRFLQEAIEAAPPRGAGISLFDPTPMSLARLAGVERAQALLQSRSRPRLQRFFRSGAKRSTACRRVECAGTSTSTRSSSSAL